MGLLSWGAGGGLVAFIDRLSKVDSWPVRLLVATKAKRSTGLRGGGLRSRGGAPEEDHLTLNQSTDITTGTAFAWVLL
jgi:hypothetical protein